MIYSVTAKIGWSNPDTGPESMRLYATDRGDSPRWDKPHARVVETAMREAGALLEGDRVVVVTIGSRFVDDELVERARVAAEEAVAAVLEGS